MKSKNFTLGLLLILVGTFMIMNRIFNMELFTMSKLWPLFVLVPGLTFEVSYFSNRRNAGILVPGGILTTIGILFLFETYTNWSFSGYTWPIYPLAVAIGLFQLYIFSERRNTGLLIPVAILTLVSVISFVNLLFSGLFYWLNYQLVLPIILILIGLYILFSNSRR